MAEEVVADFNINLLIIKLFIFYGYHFVYQIKRSPHKAGKLFFNSRVRYKTQIMLRF